MRAPSDEDAPFIAELFSRESREPMSVERIRRLLESPLLDRERDARVTDWRGPRHARARRA